MLVKEVMSPNPQVVNVDTTLREAALKLRESSNGVIPVVGNNGALIGVVTEDDITIEAAAEGKGDSDKISDILVAELYFCFEGDSIDEARLQMQEHKVSCLVVLDNNERMRLVGTISLDELVENVDSNRADVAAACCE